MSQVLEIFEFGGVDSRSNPLAFPPGRALRCKNWIKKPAGYLKLRYGYTEPTMSVVDTGSPIHSAYFFEHHDGSKFVIFGQGAAIKLHDISSGTVSTLGTVSNGDGWAGFFANNSFHFGNPGFAKVWDGTTLRDSGIRSPNSTESGGASISVQTSGGSWLATQLSGYQLYMSYYNPNTGQVGNRIKIGSRFIVPGGETDGSIQVSGLPNLSSLNSEWVKVIGRTCDNGEVPYLFVDGNGAWVTVGNTSTTVTFTLPDVDYASEMPTRNTVPPGMNLSTWVLGRVYGVDPNDPRAIRFSEREDDTVAGFYVGRPEQSWPADNKLYFPTNEAIRGIHEVDNEVWVWSATHLAIFSELGGYSLEGRPTPMLRGLWPGGLAGQRAFVKCPHGPFWLSTGKDLMTRGPDGPVVVSGEYKALLAKIADSDVANIEIAYLQDFDQEIDRLYITGRDGSGNPLVIVHDFIHNEGVSFEYSNLLVDGFVHPSQNEPFTRDAAGHARLWATAGQGSFAQLEDGDSDNGATYSADYLTIVNTGPSEPTLYGIEWQGDGNVEVTVTDKLNLTSTDLDAIDSQVADEVSAEESRYRAGIEQARQFFLLRLQLDSHPADGTLDESDTPHLPLETYGRILVARPEFGKQRRVGGRVP